MPVRDGLGIWRFRRLRSLRSQPLSRSLNRRKTAITKTTKAELKTQKNRLNRRFFCKIWSECGDSNPGPPAPKAGALPTAQHPDMKLWDCPGVSSQMCVGTFNWHYTALFDAFPCSSSFSLELFCPACFKKPFRLLGFVWDWILCIKRCSARFEGAMTGQSPQSRGAGNAPHKQRIRPWCGVHSP